MRNFNRTILMLGTALLLQACESAGGSNNIAVTNNVAAVEYGQVGTVSQEMTGDDVRVFGLDEPTEPSAIFSDTGPGYPLTPPDAKVGTDPNVQVYPLDGGNGMAYRGGEIPPMMPPAAQNPYQSPFPNNGSSSGIQLRPPSGMAGAPANNGAVQTAPLSAAYPPQTYPPPYGAPSMTPPPRQAGVMQGYPEVSRIYFNHGSSALNGAGKQVITDVARQQQANNPAGLVEVEAHASSRAEAADPVERRIANLKMSMDRAYKVSSALMRAGVPATSIRTTAYGDTRPAPEIPGYSAEAASRRVEIMTQP